MKPNETVELIRILRRAYPRQQVDAGTIEIYCNLLADLNYTRARDAVKAIVSTHKFFPTIAEIRDMTIGMSCNFPSAEEAWGEVRAAIHSVGSYRKPGFQHQVTAHTVDAMGWDTLCMSENISVERAHFFRIFESMVDREKYRINLDSLANLESSKPELKLLPDVDGNGDV